MKRTTPRPNLMATAPFGKTTALACLAYTRHLLETTLWYIDTFGYDYDCWLASGRLSRNEAVARTRGKLHRIEQRIARYLETGIDKVVPVVPWSNL